MVAILLSAVLAWAAAGSTPCAAVPLSIQYDNEQGEGFFDSELGEARRTAFEAAVAIWADALPGSVPVIIATRMVPFGGSGTGALLAQAGSVTVHRNFGGGATPSTWYSAAVASQIIDSDINGADLPEISVDFNSDLDDNVVLGSVGWYYGLDAEPGTDIDLITIALHELAHGLGFFSQIEPVAGGWQIANNPSSFDRRLRRPFVDGFSEMVDSERLAAIISANLQFTGPATVNDFGAAPPVQATAPFIPGSSISHWDTGLSPDELMEPFYTSATRDLRLTLSALLDVGWGLVPGAPTAVPVTSTPTATPSPTPTTALPAGNRPDRLYVTNFDDNTVSVIDPARGEEIATIAVGLGPAGIAVSRDGSRIFVASFREGSLYRISARTLDTLGVTVIGSSANDVAVDDSGLVLITDTAADTVVVADQLDGSVLHTIAAGEQPAGIALAPRGRFAYVANFGETTVTVVDSLYGLRRAIIPMRFATSFGIARGAGNLLLLPSRNGAQLSYLDAGQIQLTSLVYLPNGLDAESAVQTADPRIALVLMRNRRTGEGVVVAVDSETREDGKQVSVGDAPEDIESSTDGRTVYVANTGSDSISVINTVSMRVKRTIDVGRAPMAIAVAQAPIDCGGDCDGNGLVSVSELVRAVNIALGAAPARVCEPVDSDSDDRVSIDELIGAVNNALGTCDQRRGRF